MSDKHQALPISPVFFDEATALKLAQVFGQQSDLRELLRLLFVQMRAVCNSSGLHFINPDKTIEHHFGQSSGHHAEYNLHFRDQPVGTLTRYFSRPQQDQDIQTGEDLIGLALLPIRNALQAPQSQVVAHAAASASTSGLSVDEKIALAEIASPDQGQTKADTLILVSLDDYSLIAERDGSDWADILITSVHEQLTVGLRSADGVYHIGDDLVGVLLPRTTEAQAQQVAQKIRVLITSLHLGGKSEQAQLTASMGISSSAHGSTAEDVMANARIALAQARTQGPNQIKVYDPTEERDAG